MYMLLRYSSLERKHAEHVIYRMIVLYAILFNVQDDTKSQRIYSSGSKLFYRLYSCDYSCQLIVNTIYIMYMCVLVLY